MPAFHRWEIHRPHRALVGKVCPALERPGFQTPFCRRGTGRLTDRKANNERAPQAPADGHQNLPHDKSPCFVQPAAEEVSAPTHHTLPRATAHAQPGLTTLSDALLVGGPCWQDDSCFKGSPACHRAGAGLSCSFSPLPWLHSLCPIQPLPVPGSRQAPGTSPSSLGFCPLAEYGAFSEDGQNQHFVGPGGDAAT